MPLDTSRLPIKVQDRDFAVLRGLFESRVMTLAHAATLHFEGRKEAAKKRIQKLKTASFVAERKRKPYEPSVLYITRKAFLLLSEHGQLAGFPRLTWGNLEKRAQVSERTLRHELAVMDVKAAFFNAVRKVPKLHIAEFSTWPLLYQFKASPAYGVPEIMVKPDGFIRIQEEEEDGGLSEHTFFLEVDLSTEPQETLALRAAAYVDYYRRGGLAVKNGRPRTDYKDFPFRVLMVFKSAERRDNTAMRLLRNNPPIMTQVWLTTKDFIVMDPLGAIWMRPSDYQYFIAPSVRLTEQQEVSELRHHQRAVNDSPRTLISQRTTSTSH